MTVRILIIVYYVDIYIYEMDWQSFEILVLCQKENCESRSKQQLQEISFIKKLTSYYIVCFSGSCGVSEIFLR